MVMVKNEINFSLIYRNFHCRWRLMMMMIPIIVRLRFVFWTRQNVAAVDFWSVYIVCACIVCVCADRMCGYSEKTTIYYISIHRMLNFSPYERERNFYCFALADIIILPIMIIWKEKSNKYKKFFLILRFSFRF